MTEFEKGVLAMLRHVANRLDDDALRSGCARVARELIELDAKPSIAQNAGQNEGDGLA